MKTPKAFKNEIGSVLELAADFAKSAAGKQKARDLKLGKSRYARKRKG